MYDHNACLVKTDRINIGHTINQVIRFSGVTFNTEIWKEFKRMVLEAAAETVDDQDQKELVVKAWGKLVCQVIGEMKNGFFMEAMPHCEQFVEQPSGGAISSNSGGTELMSVRAEVHRPIQPVGMTIVSKV